MSWEYRVSFLMPVYGGEDFVADAIESVLDQTVDSVELVVVNDGSPDDSEAVIEEYLPHDDIVYVSQDNAGVTAATNRAIELASGEYLGVHPQDDVSEPDRLEKQVAVLDEHPDVGFVYSPATFVDLDGEPFTTWGNWRGEGRVDAAAFFEKLYREGMFLASPSVLFRRDHITDDERPWGDPDLRVVSDWEHWLVAAQHYDAVYEMADPIVRMLRDDDHANLGRSSDTVFAEEKVVLRRIRRQYADGDPPVTRRHFARAMSNHSVRELRYRLYETGEYLGGLRATLRALRYDPRNGDLYREYGSILRSLF
jgi:glycosyltransferase involved in cell wall biosynthesis